MSDGKVELPVKDEEELVLDGATCASFFLFFEVFFLSVGRLGGAPLFLDTPEFVMEELFPLGFFPDFKVFLGANGTEVVLGRALSTVVLFIRSSEEELELLATFIPVGSVGAEKLLSSWIVFSGVLSTYLFSKSSLFTSTSDLRLAMAGGEPRFVGLPARETVKRWVSHSTLQSAQMHVPLSPVQPRRPLGGVASWGGALVLRLTVGTVFAFGGAGVESICGLWARSLKGGSGRDWSSYMRVGESVDF